jgi:hypothetical protein
MPRLLAEIEELPSAALVAVESVFEESGRLIHARSRIGMARRSLRAL